MGMVDIQLYRSPLCTTWTHYEGSWGLGILFFYSKKQSLAAAELRQQRPLLRGGARPDDVAPGLLRDLHREVAQRPGRRRDQHL